MAARPAPRSRLSTPPRTADRRRRRLRRARARRPRRTGMSTVPRRADPRAARAPGRGMSTVTLPAIAPVDSLPITPAPGDAPTLSTASLDEESREWLRALRADGSERDAAVARLHALLVRAARFEVARRRPALPHIRGDELDDIALEAADDALDERAAPARRLPRREPVHDLGLQVRAARGGGEASQARLAGARGAARAGDVEPLRERRRSDAGRARRSRTSSSARCSRRSATSSHRTSGASWSRSRSTACRSTSSPTTSGRPAAPSTRPCTTHGASCAGTSTSAATRSTTWRSD